MNNQQPIPRSAGTPSPYAAVAAYYASFLILGLATGAEGPSLPTLAQHTLSSLDRISLMFVTGSLGYVIGSLLGGRLYDRVRGHRLMAGCLALMAVAAILYPLAGALWVLLSAAFAMGIGKGAVDAGCNTLLQWLLKQRAGPYLNGLHFAFGFGSLFSPILLAQIISRTHDIEWVFWTISLVTVPVAAWMWLLPEPQHAMGASTREAQPVSWLPVALIVTAFFLYVGAEVGFSSWVYTFAISLKLADAVRAAYLTSAYWALFTLGRLGAIWIATRFKPRTILVVDFAGCLLSLAVIWAGTASQALLWVGTMAFGLAMASIFPTMLLLAAERLRVTGTVTGWFLLGAGAGGMLLPWLIGNAFVPFGPGAMIILIFIDLILNIGVLAVFVARRPAAELPEAAPAP